MRKTNVAAVVTAGLLGLAGSAVYLGRVTFAPPPPSSIVFQEVTAQAGINTDAPDWGYATTADIDGDGWDDLVLNRHPGTHFYRNRRDGTFVRVTPTGIPPASEATKHRHVFAWCDLDGDGDEDLIVGTGIRGPEEVDPHQFPRAAEDLWFRNDGNFAFTDMTAAWGTKHPGSNVQAIGCLDVDRDGRLDVLLVDTQTFDRAWDATFPVYALFMNRLPSGFVNEYRRIHMEPGFYPSRETIVTYSVDCGDLVRSDGAQDCITGSNQNSRWIVQGLDPYRDPIYSPADGTFYSTEAGADIPDHLAPLGSYNFEIALADFNGDGRLDIVRADYNDVGIIIQCGVDTPGGGAPLRECFRHTPPRPRAAVAPTTLAVGDFDNDGDVDFFVAIFGEEARDGRQIDAADWFFRNDGNDAQGNPRFSEVAAAAGVAGPFIGNFEVGAGAATVIDYDKDGRLDLVIGYGEADQRDEFRRPILLYRNVTATPNGWIGLILRPAGASIGAKIETRLTGMADPWRVTLLTARTGWLSQDSRNVHVGLGPLTVGIAQNTVDVRITWPNGRVQTVTLPANQYHVVREGQPGPTPTPTPTPPHVPLSCVATTTGIVPVGGVPPYQVTVKATVRDAAGNVASCSAP